jgi:hypothetical protein
MKPHGLVYSGLLRYCLIVHRITPMLVVRYAPHPKKFDTHYLLEMESLAAFWSSDGAMYVHSSLHSCPRHPQPVLPRTHATPADPIRQQRPDAFSVHGPVARPALYRRQYQVLKFQYRNTTAYHGSNQSRICMSHRLRDQSPPRLCG